MRHLKFSYLKRAPRQTESTDYIQKHLCDEKPNVNEGESCELMLEMVSRKKAAGKARKAAKAKARKEAEEKERNNQTANDQEALALLDAMRQWPCTHGADYLFSDSFNNICLPFVTAFASIVENFEGGISSDFVLSDCLTTACNETMDEFAEVWRDCTKIEMVISYCLAFGMQYILDGDGDYNDARGCAVTARYLEQYVLVRFKRSQAMIHWIKLFEMRRSDMHTLVKFFRHRIPCSCLDEKYEEVKDIVKMGMCFNPQCTLPNRMTERSKTMYCSRCRNAVYCSRECQISDWTNHKPDCDSKATTIAEFEAKQQK